MSSIIVYSDVYKCSTIFCWKRGCLEVRGISYEGDGVDVSDVIKDIADLSGVPEDEIRKLLRKLRRKAGYFSTTLKDLEDFVKKLEGEKHREEVITARLQLLATV